MKERRSLVRNSLVRKRVARLSDENFEHEHMIERGPSAARAVGAGHGLLQDGLLQVSPKQLEVDDRVQPFEMVALGRKLLQMLVDVEEPGLTAHPRTPVSPREREPSSPFKGEVFGGLQL